MGPPMKALSPRSERILGAVGEYWRQAQKSTLKERSRDRSCASHSRTVIFKVDGSDVWRLALQLAKLMASQLTTLQVQLAGPEKNRDQKLARIFSS